MLLENGKPLSVNPKVEDNKGVYVYDPGAFKLDHLEFTKPILIEQISRRDMQYFLFPTVNPKLQARARVGRARSRVRFAFWPAHLRARVRVRRLPKTLALLRWGGGCARILYRRSNVAGTLRQHSCSSFYSTLPP